MKSMRPWIILALIFVLGVVTGSLLTVGFGPRFATGTPGPLDIRNHWMVFLVHRLDLTADQQAKIQPIVFKAETNIQAVHRDDIARISAIMKEANASIAEVLDPGQKAELEKMEQDRERMFAHHLHGQGHGPGEFHGPHGDHPHGGPPPDGPLHEAPSSSTDGTNAPPPES
jgi:Spy/CpxP family protein refolding chaperone